MSAVEQAVENINPHYKRNMKQNNLQKWKDVFCSNNLFSLTQYKEYDHNLHIESQQAFLITS